MNPKKEPYTHVRTTPRYIQSGSLPQPLIAAEPWPFLMDVRRQISFSGMEGTGGGRGGMKRAVTSVRSAVQRLAAEREVATATRGLGTVGSFSLGASLKVHSIVMKRRK